MVFLIAISFLVLILVTDSKFSTLGENDIEIIRKLLPLIFGVNLIIRIIAHMSFRETIKDLIEKHKTLKH